VETEVAEEVAVDSETEEAEVVAVDSVTEVAEAVASVVAVDSVTEVAEVVVSVETEVVEEEEVEFNSPVREKCYEHEYGAPPIMLVSEIFS
jgi:hypothetical protein